MEEEQEILMSMSRDGARIVAPSVSESFEKKSISPSMITGLLGAEACHVRWLAQTFVTRQILPTPVDNEAQRGVLFHKVLEDICHIEPKAERTKPKLKEIMIDTLSSEEFKAMSKIPEVRNWLSLAVKSYYDMGGDPTKIDIARVAVNDGTERNDGNQTPKKGLELFVKGNLGGASRDTLGYVDMITDDPNTAKQGRESVVITDWKSGAKSKVWKKHTKSSEGLAEQRQQIIYTKILRNQGIDVSAARLVYPVAKTVVNVDMEDEELFKRVDENVKETDEMLDTLQETNEFEYTPSFLCAWCPLAKICPKAQIKPYAKMQDAFAKQPEYSELEKGIELL